MRRGPRRAASGGSIFKKANRLASVEIGESFASLIHEKAGQNCRFGDLINAQFGEILGLFTPDKAGPKPSPIIQLQRAHGAAAFGEGQA